MNEPSKKLLFNKSMLFNLKAELLKKQEEVLEKKQLPQNKVENFKPPPPKPEKDKSEKVPKKSFKDGLKGIDVEELEACRKAKAVLEKKAELYNHLADGVGTSQLADRFLVDFQTKKQEEVREAVLTARNDYDDDTQTLEGDDGWTEFTDCLGRTRKCHKSDLEMFKKRDHKLKKTTLKDNDGGISEEPEIQEEKKDTPLLVQKTNDYLQSLREKWEDKEREMIGKDRDIHYQDLLFDEARIHGVGYYSFSTDEKERRKQMDELIKSREETLLAQKQTEETRKKRDELMAARIKAARARQRARAGLPPEEPEEDRESFTTRLLEFLTQQRDQADLKADEVDKKKKEEQEQERQKLREAYVREWDLGKEGVEGNVKKFREMTQEEYVAQQRDKRIDEFAPYQPASSSKSNYTFDDNGSMVGVEDFTPARTWSDVRPKAKTPPPPELNDAELQQKGLYYSSKQQKEDNNIPTLIYEKQSPKTPVLSTKRDVKYRNFVKSGEPTPIVNELSDDSDNDDVRENNKRRIDGTEMAPPPTYDYYGPVPKKIKHQKPFQSDIREAYDQGTKSLESKSSSRQLSKDYDFTFG